MKKGGKLALAIYILGTVFGALLAGWSYFQINYIESNAESGWESLGYALVLVLGLVIMVPYAVSLIFKIIHFVSEKAVFGVLCIIIDISLIACLVLSYEDWSYLLLIIPSTLALISNVRSMKN